MTVTPTTKRENVPDVLDPVALASEELAAGRMVLLRDDCERRG